MPIFAQSAIPGRMAGANLQRLRFRDGDREDGRRVGAAEEDSRTERTDEDAEPRAVARGRDLRELLFSNQRGAQISQRLQFLRAGRGHSEEQPETPPATDVQDGGTRATARPALRSAPGVGTVRTAADAAVQRVGRLVPGAASPLIERTAQPFGAVNVQPQARAEQRPATGRAALPSDARTETPPLDQARDANIRLLAARSAEQAPRADTAVAPTAEQISRANTTEEIRENLQAGTRAVGTELTAVAAQQTAANAERVTQAAEQAGAQRQENQAGTNEAEVRELRTEERQLERELRQKEREIRQRQNENARIETGVSAGGSAGALAIGTRLNLLSV